MIESKKERDPTMEGPGMDEEETDDQKLHHLFQTLEQEWDFIKQRAERRSSTGSSKMIKVLGLLNNSPRKLMSSLQHRSSPASERGAWRVRTNDLAVEEILNERRAAIESGKLKGRRLFQEVEGVTEVGFGSEVRSVFSYESENYQDENLGRKDVFSPSCPHCCSYSSSSSSLCAETIQRGRIQVTTSAEKRIPCDAGSGRGRWTVIMVWVAVTFVVCIVGIISGRSLCAYEDEEVILTPT